MAWATGLTACGSGMDGEEGEPILEARMLHKFAGCEPMLRFTREHMLEMLESGDVDWGMDRSIDETGKLRNAHPQIGQRRLGHGP